MRIPMKNRDLRRYVFKKTFKRCLFFFLWMVVWFGGAMFYNAEHQTYPEERRMTGWRLTLLMFLMFVVGFLLFRMWKIWTERSVCGIIETSDLSHTYTTADSPRCCHAGGYEHRLKKTLRIRTANGSHQRIRFEQKNGSYLYYREGTEVIRFYGLPYPIEIDRESFDGYVCVACGRHSDVWTERCVECGFSLVDPRDLFLR